MGGAAGRRAAWECEASRGTWGAAAKVLGEVGVGVASHLVSVQESERGLGVICSVVSFSFLSSPPEAVSTFCLPS